MKPTQKLSELKDKKKSIDRSIGRLKDMKGKIDEQIKYWSEIDDRQVKMEL